MDLKESFSYHIFEQEAIDKLKRGVSMEGKNGGLSSLIKRLLDASF